MLDNRVEQRTLTLGTGAYTLDQVVAGHRTFVGTFAHGATVHYTVVSVDGAVFEANEGVLDTSVAPATLSRARLIDSSTGAAINWPDGSAKIIYCDAPAELFGPIGKSLLLGTLDGTSTVDALVVKTAIKTPVLKDGMMVGVNLTGPNTLGNPTLKLNNLAVKTITLPNNGALMAGHLKAGRAWFTYRAAADAWLLETDLLVPEELRVWAQIEPDTVTSAVNRNVTAADRGKVLTLTGGTDRTFTFTDSWATLGDGWTCWFKNASTATLTIVPASGTIDGAAALALKPGEIVELRGDGANGETIGGKLIWRERLVGPRTYYVRTDGNDANTGLVNSAGGAFLTAQKAANVIKDNLDLAGFVVTVQHADGTYTGGVILEGFCVGQKNYSSIVFQGNNAAPANVLVHTTALGWCFYARSGAQFTVKDLKVQTTTSGSCIRSVFPGSIVICRGVEFGPCANNQVEASYQAYASLNNGDPYTISGGAVRHLQATHNGMIDASVGATITLTGTPNYSQEFAGVDIGGIIVAFGNTYSGAATGKRYEITTNGNIATNGAGANYFPGNVAGTNDGTGTYT
jgi:hypothetical protein